jgi:hypothetical protein
LIPWFDGAICSLEWKEAFWDKYVMVLSRFGSGHFRAMFAMKEIKNGNEFRRDAVRIAHCDQQRLNPWGNIAFDEMTSTYDPASGLTLTVPVSTMEFGDTLSMTTNQVSATMTADIDKFELLE